MSHNDIGRTFDAQLGYFPLTGVRAETFAAGYTPLVRTDLVHQVFLDAQPRSPAIAGSSVSSTAAS